MARLALAPLLLTTLFLMALFLTTLLPAGCGDDDTGEADASMHDAGDDGGSVLPPVDASRTDASPGDAAPGDAGSDAGPPVDPVAGAGTVEPVASDFEGDGFGFLEGSHWRDGRLVFSDLIFGNPGRQTIYALTPPSTLEILVRPSEGANGNGTRADGAHVTCLQAGRRVALVTEEGGLETLFDRYEGAALNAPNDLAFTAAGRWYFTDPGYGVEPGAREIDAHGVYLVDGETLTRVWTGTTEQRPNGVALSPDDATLYLADTADGVVRAFDVQADGTLENVRTFATGTDGADGMTVDAAGNLYVATSTGVRAYAPDGTAWGTLDVPMAPSNVAFGGPDRRTLYITARTTLYRVAMAVPGIEGR